MDSSIIYIDPSAANADISKIRSAISKLEESQSSIKKLKANADGMQGQTGRAIQEKCIVLSSQIDSLKTNLNYTIRLIQAAVKEYQAKDRELAAAIKSGGI